MLNGVFKVNSNHIIKNNLYALQLQFAFLQFQCLMLSRRGNKQYISCFFLNFFSYRSTSKGHSVQMVYILCQDKHITCAILNWRKAFQDQQLLYKFLMNIRHIKTLQKRLLCHTHVYNNKIRLSKKIFLRVLHDQTSVESL